MSALISRFVAVTFRPVGTDLFEVAKRGQALGRVRFSREGTAPFWDAYSLQGMRIGRYFADADGAAFEVASWVGLSVKEADLVDPADVVTVTKITGRVYPPALVSA